MQILHFHDACITKIRCTSHNCVLITNYAISTVVMNFIVLAFIGKICQPLKSWDKFNSPPDILPNIGIT